MAWTVTIEPAAKQFMAESNETLLEAAYGPLATPIAIGTAVTGGLLSATFIDLIFIPFFFVMVSRLFGRKRYRRNGGDPAAADTERGL